jgi:hypothetical protein
MRPFIRVAVVSRRAYFLLLCTFALASCEGNDTTVTGSYVAEKPIASNGISLGLTVLEDGSPSERHSVRVKEDGTFSVSIPQGDGTITAMLGISGTDTSKWRDPYISSQLGQFTIDTTKERIDIGTVYISDAMRVFTGEGTSEDVTFHEPTEISLRWDAISFADFYSIAIARVLENDEFELFWDTHNLSEASFQYSEAVDYEVIEGDVAPNEFSRRGPFNRTSKPLRPGRYEVRVSAYKVADDRLVRVGHTSDLFPFRFTLSEGP